MCQLEQTHDADDAEKLQKVVLSVEPRQQEVEVERDGRHEVDNVDRSAKKAQDVWTDGKAHEQLERKPGVTGALDVEEREVRIGGALIQKPDNATAVWRARHCDVDDNRYAKVRVSFETEDSDGDKNEEDRQCRDDLDNETTVSC